MIVRGQYIVHKKNLENDEQKGHSVDQKNNLIYNCFLRTPECKIVQMWLSKFPNSH